ncbi:MAG: hypothetical protein HONBIEJF_02545 [Fimbriimonadaceae bacterium]|nr:hypothetical protein [Fimbriimonadaceae bacterium]
MLRIIVRSVLPERANSANPRAELVEITERNKTTRHRNVCITISVCVLAICYTVIKVADKTNPIIELIALLLAPGGLLCLVVQAWISSIQKKHKYIQRLERELDPHREGIQGGRFDAIGEGTNDD